MTREELLKVSKPVLFNTDMVKAILDGRKTVTRRRVGEKVCIVREDQKINKNLNGEFELYNITTRCGLPQNVFFKPPYQPGDILYVRETWSELSFGYVYKADGENIDHLGNVIKWRPSIHMPKEAARIFLKVTDVRVERLQDITEYQIVAEGTPYDKEDYEQWRRGDKVTHNAETYLRGYFRELWNSTIKKSDLDRYGWEANPWVWVIEFKRCKKPEREG